MSNDEQQIRSLVARWMDATRAGDSETVLSLMSEDVVFLTPGRPPMRGRDSFAAAVRAQAAQNVQFEGTSEIEEINVIGEWAFMWTRLTVVARMPGETRATTRAGNTLSILKKENARWV